MGSEVFLFCHSKDRVDSASARQAVCTSDERNEREGKGKGRERHKTGSSVCINSVRISVQFSSSLRSVHPKFFRFIEQPDSSWGCASSWSLLLAKKQWNRGRL